MKASTFKAPTDTFLRHTKRHRTYLSVADPILAEVIASHKLRPRQLNPDPFHSLARSIIGQQLSVKAAASIYAKVRALFPRSKTFPSPQVFLRMSPQKLGSAGLSASKVDYIRNAAEFIISHKSSFARLNTLSDNEVIELLTQIKGIGVWTAEMFLMFSLGRQDIFSYGDYGLRLAMKNIYHLRKMPSKRRAKEISDAWKPFRSHGSLYLWESLNNTEPA